MTSSRLAPSRQRAVSGSDATRTHGPIHTGTSPQFSGTQLRSPVRGRTANQRSHRRGHWFDPSIAQQRHRRSARFLGNSPCQFHARRQPTARPSRRCRGDQLPNASAAMW